MRNGPQERSLERVAAPQRLGLEGLAGKTLAIDGHGEKRGQSGQKPLSHPG